MADEVYSGVTKYLVKPNASTAPNTAAITMTHALRHKAVKSRFKSISKTSFLFFLLSFMITPEDSLTKYTKKAKKA